MYVSSYLAIGALAAASSVYGQQTVNGTYVTGLLQVLQTAGLTTLSSTAQSLASTPLGGQFLAAISTGPKTLFAPNNNAFEGVPSNVTSNSTLLGSILSYHLVSGNFPGSSIATLPNVTVARTYLTDSALVSLEGNKTQAIAFAVDPQRHVSVILNQNTEVTITNTYSYENLIIHVVDAVIDVPGTLQAALDTTATLSTLRTQLDTVNFITPLSNAHGITIFAPNNTAFSAISGALGSLNETQVASILANHVINGTTVYSPILTQGTYHSAGGAPFTFAYNSSGVFVTSGSSTAKVVKSDILIKNGVIHIIDGVLLNNASDAQAAQSAYNGYTSSAAAAATQTVTGGVGVTPTETGAIGGTSIPAGQSSAVRLGSTGAGLGAIVTIVGMTLAGAALMI